MPTGDRHPPCLPGCSNLWLRARLHPPPSG